MIFFWRIVSTQIDLPIFCSIESQQSNLDASWIKLGDKLDFYLIFEFNHPWDKWVEKSDHFPLGLTEYLQKIKGEGRKFKYFCIKSENDGVREPRGAIRVLYYRGNQTGFVSFEKTELVLQENKFLEVIMSLVENDPQIYEKYEVQDNNSRNIFICTHDNRDQCCGLFGNKILKKLKTINSKSTKNSAPSVRIWQSSHMGGHRVGPTFMDMPSGRVWGYLDDDLVQQIFNRDEDHNKVLKNYRGTLGLDRYSQIVDKAIFEIKGWDWLNVKKRSEIILEREQVTSVKIVYKSKTESGEYRADVINIGKIILPATQCSKSTTMSKFEVMNLKQTIY